MYINDQRIVQIYQFFIIIIIIIIIIIRLEIN